MTDQPPSPDNDDAPEEISCPKCGSQMQRIYVDALTVDRCIVCRGLWLDVTERDRLLHHPEAVKKVDCGPMEPARVMDKVTQIICPRDGSTMIHQVDAQQRNVGFESCSICGGVFLDAGELRDLSEVSMLERLKMLLG